jgi:hypothetical protein
MSHGAHSRIYCTYFDSGYLARGLTLIDSLRENKDHSPVVVLALDSETYEYFEQFPVSGVTCEKIDALEAFEPRLIETKSSRSRMEYYFTCTPILIRYVMEKLASPGSTAIYLDADLFFFNDPSIVLTELAVNDVGIISHKYQPRLRKKLSKYGTYNVGWLGFRDSTSGRAVLDWYRERTLEWCFDKPEDGKYADQGYLDWFPEFTGVTVLTSPGFNLAPWNSANYRVITHDRQVFVNESPLVFFHFHGLRRVKSWFVTSQLVYSAPASRNLMNLVYRPYVSLLNRNEQLVSRRLQARIRIKPRGRGLRGWLGRTRKQAVNLASILSGNAVYLRD